MVNVVATSDLRQSVDLEKIGDLKFGVHDDMFYGGRVAYLKSPTMKGRVSIFRSGKMISVGTKSSEEAFDDLKTAMEIIVDAGLTKPITLNMEVRNMVASVDLEREDIDLNLFASKFYEVTYEPEQFPGAICRLIDFPGVTILLFSTGKAVITGVRNLDQLSRVVNQMASFLANL